MSMETKSKPPAPDIFVAYETPAVNSVDQLGDADFHGPFPSSAFEVIQNHQINHERDDDTEKLTSNSTNCIRPQNYCGITTVLQNRDLRSMNVPSALCMKLNLPILQQFLDVSYIFCTIPFTRIHASLCLRYFQCFVYWVIVGFSCLHALISLNIAYTRKDVKELHRYTEIGFHAVDLVCKVYGVVVFMALKDKASQVMKLLLQLEVAYVDLSTLMQKSHVELPSYKWLVVLCGILPMTAAILWGVFDFWSLKDWNLAQVIYNGAVDVGRTFVVWELGEWDTSNNRTEQLLFGNTPDAAWISLGIVRMCGEAAAAFKEFAMRNLMVAIGASLIKHTLHLSTLLSLLRPKLLASAQNGQTENNQEAFAKAWKYYFQIRQTSAEINKTFGGLAKCTHMTNMLMLMYFILTVISKQQTIISFILFLYDIALVALFYFIAMKIYDVNDDARKWIKDNTVANAPIEVDVKTLNVLLDDIRQAPIGMGAGVSIVDSGFMQRFVGILASLLVFMVDAEVPQNLGDNFV